jgi:hypothetical protein
VFGFARYHAHRRAHHSAETIAFRLVAAMAIVEREATRDEAAREVCRHSYDASGTPVEDDRCKFFARRVDLFFTTRDLAVTLFLCVRYFQKEE